MSQQGLIELTWYDDENGDEVKENFPSKMAVCDDCGGHGSVLIEGLRNHCFTSEEFNEAFDDEEDREAYFTAGSKYHTQCPTCLGKNVVAVVDEDILNKEQKKLYLEYCDHERVRAEWDYEDRMTRRMENGGYD